MECLNCKKDLFKRGAVMADSSTCAGEHIDIRWLDGKEYIECKHCTAKNFIEDTGPHTSTVRRFSVD